MRKRTAKWLTMLQIIVLQRTFDKSVCVSGATPRPNWFQTLRTSQRRCRICVNYFAFRSKTVECDGVNYYYYYSQLAPSQWHCRSGEVHCAKRSRRFGLTASCDGCVINHASWTHFVGSNFEYTSLRTWASTRQPASQPFTLYFVATMTSFHAQRHVRALWLHRWTNSGLSIGHMKPNALMVSIEDWAMSIAVTAPPMDSEKHRNVQLLISVRCVFLSGQTDSGIRQKKKHGNKFEINPTVT